MSSKNNRHILYEFEVPDGFECPPNLAVKTTFPGGGISSIESHGDMMRVYSEDELPDDFLDELEDVGIKVLGKPTVVYPK